MRKIKLNLSKQLIIITSFSLLLMILLIIFIVPKTLNPYFEDTVYSYLDKPLEIISKEDFSKSSNIVYIRKKLDGTYETSREYYDMFNEDVSTVMNNINDVHGKFIINNKTYYYSNKGRDKEITALTDDTYLKELKNNMLMVIIPVVVIIFAIIMILLLLWVNYIVNRIEKLKLKVDNFDNPDFKLKENSKLDDEILVLDYGLDKMKEEILSKEKYEREMYQNISHDFKTPIMVVNSYIEAYNDKIKTGDEVIDVTKKEMDKLSKKVTKLLELNKVTYLKNNYNKNTKVDIIPLLNDKIEKYKVINKKINYTLDIKSKEKVKGDLDIWESVIDNILSNMERYAKENIKITLNKKEIIFYNDGENIKEDLINKVFDSYIKGDKGKHGLGLSIVKKNLDLIDYKINVKNLKNGVSFVIVKD